MAQVQAALNDEYKPRVSPRLHPSVRACLENSDFLIDLVDRLGSPLNVIFPDNLQGNIMAFEDVYKKHKIRGRIYYVTKPCKSRSLMREALRHKVGIDVSSPASLQEALRLQWEPSRVVANGPKNKMYLKLALENNILINVDNIEELQTIVALQKNLDGKARVGVRLCGFHSARIDFTPHDSTFGIHIRNLDWIIAYLIQHKDVIDFKGFSFHIAGTNQDQKIVAIENLLAATFAAIKKGLSPKGINIGGGYPIMYADSCKQWNDYVDTLKQSVLQKTETQTWNNTGLGFKVQNGVLAGGAMFTDHAPFRAKDESLDFLLSSPLPDFGGATFASVLQDSLLELDIEPGKAMLDQCGITLGKVMFSKESAHGETLVGLDMNRSNIQSSDQKMLTDPIVLYRDQKQNTRDENGVFYMGNLCLAYDMIQYNKTYPEFLPRSGDVVAFANTAAYLMDFVESESLMQPIARKVAVTQKNGQWVWQNDEEYLNEKAQP